MLEFNLTRDGISVGGSAGHSADLAEFIRKLTHLLPIMPDTMRATLDARQVLQWPGAPHVHEAGETCTECPEDEEGAPQ